VLTSDVPGNVALHSARDTLTEMYGYALRIYVNQTSKAVCFEKEGMNVDVSGIISHFPDHDITVTLLTNMENGARDPAWKIHRIVVDGQIT
jgi:hypothetical protein